MAKIFYQEDCNLSLLEGKTIAIIGYRIQKRLKIFRFREMIPISLTSGSSRIAGKDTILEDSHFNCR